MNVISYAAPYLATAYRLDRVMVGNIFSIGLVGTMIGGFLFGYLGDRFGRRPAIILATASFGVLTLGFALAESYGALLALRLITGIAIGGMLPLSWALNIEFAPKRYRSTVVTLVMIGYSLGTAMGGPASLWLIPKFGWQAVFVFGGLASILAAVALVFFLPESIRFLASKGKRPDTIAQNPAAAGAADADTRRRPFRSRRRSEPQHIVQVFRAFPRGAAARHAAASDRLYFQLDDDLLPCDVDAPRVRGGLIHPRHRGRGGRA